MGGMTWNRYSIYFAGGGAMAIVAVAFSLRLHEETRVSVEGAADRPVPQAADSAMAGG
jgi:hypothetical protein